MITENRMKHSLGVAKKMYEMTEGRNEEHRRAMYTLGLLHDIGYAFAKAGEKHNKVGGEMLREQGYKYWREVQTHGEVDVETMSEEWILLNRADLQVESAGVDVGVERRLEDIGERYGEESKEYIDAKMLAERIGL